MKPSVTCYAVRNKRRSRLLCEAFARGCDGVAVYDARALRPGTAVFYGMHRETAPLIRQVQAEGRDWYLIDNGYFRRGTYFRITRGGWQHDGLGDGDAARWRAQRIAMKPWRRRTSGPVLVCLQSSDFFLLRGACRKRWLDGVIGRLRAVTDRPLVVREKPRSVDPSDFRRSLGSIYAVVARSSNCLVDAAIEGVPAFPTHACAATAVGNRLEAIETPRMPERERWAWTLAANQWTLSEIETGVAWRALHGLR